jgi:hypothetical protein
LWWAFFRVKLATPVETEIPVPISMARPLPLIVAPPDSTKLSVPVMPAVSGIGRPTVNGALVLVTPTELHDAGEPAGHNASFTVKGILRPFGPVRVRDAVEPAEREES